MIIEDVLLIYNYSSTRDYIRSFHYFYNYNILLQVYVSILLQI